MFLECRVSFKVYLYNLDGQTWPNDQREPDRIARRRRGRSHFQKNCTGIPATIHGLFNECSEIMPRGCCRYSNGTLSDSDSRKSGKNGSEKYLYLYQSCRLIVRTNFFKFSLLLVAEKWKFLFLIWLQIRRDTYSSHILSYWKLKCNITLIFI